MNKRPEYIRRQAEYRGRYAENIAALFLQLKGYHICARRTRTPAGEIDLVVRRGPVLAFVEVKYRHSLRAAQIAVNDNNWQRISRAAALWAARHQQFAHHDWRYDLIAVSALYIPHHFRNFWRP